MLIAYPFFWTGLFSRSQGSYQRFLAVPTRRHAQKYVLLNFEALYILPNSESILVCLKTKGFDTQHFLWLFFPYSVFFLWLSGLFEILRL